MVWPLLGKKRFTKEEQFKAMMDREVAASINRVADYLFVELTSCEDKDLKKKVTKENIVKAFNSYEIGKGE